MSDANENFLPNLESCLSNRITGQDKTFYLTCVASMARDALANFISGMTSFYKATERLFSARAKQRVGEYPCNLEPKARCASGRRRKKSQTRLNPQSIRCLH
jgi:hypothetical protein